MKRSRFDLPRGVVVPLNAIEVLLDPGPHPFEVENAAAIDANWRLEHEANPHLFDGTMVLLSELKLTPEGVLSGRCHAVRFATMLYWRRNKGSPDIEHCYAHAALVSADGALVAIRMGPHTANPGRVYGGAQDNSSSVRDADAVWDVTEVTGDGFMNAVDSTNPERVFQTSYPSSGASIIMSTVRGEPGTFAWLNTSGQDVSDPFAWVTPLVAAGGSLFVGSNRVYRATIVDQADDFSWTAISDSLTGNNNTISVMTTHENGDGTVRMVVGTANGKIATTPDALAESPAFTDITGAYPGGNVSDLAIDPADATRFFVTRSLFPAPHLMRSVGGSDWEAIGDGLPALPANSVVVDPIDPARIFVGTDIGVYESTDNGDTFAPFMVGMPLGMVVTDLEIAADPHTLVAATYGRGAWTFALDAVGDDTIFRNGFEAASP